MALGARAGSSMLGDHDRSPSGRRPARRPRHREEHPSASPCLMGTGARDPDYSSLAFLLPATRREDYVADSISSPPLSIVPRKLICLIAALGWHIEAQGARAVTSEFYWHDTS